MTPENRRGRPRAEVLNHLIYEGSSSHSTIKCKYCGRVFPREKSLQAHLRTHTGERPYACDYPGCKKAFIQSGQLKTHQRLHTGEKPFVCPVPDCNMRFTHANRHCPEHPYETLQRSHPSTTPLAEKGHSAEVSKWLERRCPSASPKKSPRRQLRSISTSRDTSEQENMSTTENNIAKGFRTTSSIETLVTSEESYGSESAVECISNQEALPVSEPPILEVQPQQQNIHNESNTTENHNATTSNIPTNNNTVKLKRRWLREVEIDVARGTINMENNNVNENLTRPSVLVNARRYQNNIPPMRMQEMQGALALMELANSSNGFYTQL